jgi:16S rRNA G966 N2-methylase RsmD
MAFLERRQARRWDVALADPPYRKGTAARLALRFRDEPFARILCIEHEPEALASELEPWRVRRYGDTELTFLRSGAD